MDSNAYTLLIVESPVIAKIIQGLSPQSVYVVATEGFCWKPRYDADNNQLKAIADPTKVSLRKEIKQQAEWAATIVVATDSDPSGDFIAWSLARFLPSKRVKRGRIQSISKNSIISMLSDLSEIEADQLEKRLKNRFLIRSEWYNQKKWPDLHLSGLISVFGRQRKYRYFMGDNEELFKSSEEIQCSSNEYIQVSTYTSGDHFAQYLPLSTYDLIPLIVSNGLSINYSDAQQLLQQLFESILRDTRKSLISYPRTDARGFYTGTWEVLQTQHLQLGLNRPLKPSFLRDVANPDTPHESIHPIDLTIKPDSIAGELSRQIGKIYKLIHEQTLKSITIPETLPITYSNPLMPDLFFYPVGKPDLKRQSDTLRPCITVGEIGMEMNRLGVLRPSGFGKSLDEWIDKRWIHINNGVVNPGKTILEQMEKGTKLDKILTELNQKAESSSLHTETIQAIITSDSLS